MEGRFHLSLVFRPLTQAEVDEDVHVAVFGNGFELFAQLKIPFRGHGIEDVVIVLCGKYTDRAKGVTAELSITKEEGIPYFLLAGHKGESVKPQGALQSDLICKWTWDNLKKLINGYR